MYGLRHGSLSQNQRPSEGLGPYFGEPYSHKALCPGHSWVACSTNVASNGDP